MSYPPVDDIVISDEPSGFPCSACNEVLNSEHGKKIHESRVHGIKGSKHKDTEGESEPKKRKATPGSGKKPLVSKATKLDAKSKTLTVDLLCAGIAWIAIRYAMGQGVEIAKSEQDAFLIPDHNRDVMFKPLIDLLEQATPAVRLVNTIGERFDYISCLMLWKEYRDNVIATVEERKEQQGGIPNGPTGPSNKPNGKQSNGSDGGSTDYGEFIPSGFGQPDQA